MASTTTVLPRNPNLESEVITSTDDHACGVYADWLEQEGQHVMAAGYRLLAGVADAQPDVARWAGTFAVTAAVWLLPWREEFDDARAKLLLAIERAKVAKTERDPAAGISDDAWREVHRAIARLADFAKDPDDTAALVDAVRAARACVDRALFHRLFGCALRTAAATGSPITASPALATSLSALTEADVAAIEVPLAGDSGSISFPEVIITNNQAGIDLEWWRRPATLSPAAALHAMAAASEWTEPSTYNTMTPPERLAWWRDDFAYGEDVDWSPMSYVDMMAFLFEQQAHNRGKPMLLDRKPAHVVDALELLGTFSGGAQTSGDFPMFYFALEHANVFGRITY